MNVISTCLMTRTESNPQIYELYILSGTEHSFRWPLPANPMMSCDCHWAARCVLFSRENLWARHSLALSAHSKKCGSSDWRSFVIFYHSAIYLATTFLTAGHKNETKNRKLHAKLCQAVTVTADVFVVVAVAFAWQCCLWHICQTLTLCKSSNKKRKQRGKKEFVGVARHDAFKRV